MSSDDARHSTCTAREGLCPHLPSPPSTVFVSVPHRSLFYFQGPLHKVSPSNGLLSCVVALAGPYSRLQLQPAVREVELGPHRQRSRFVPLASSSFSVHVWGPGHLHGAGVPCRSGGDANRLGDLCIIRCRTGCERSLGKLACSGPSSLVACQEAEARRMRTGHWLVDLGFSLSSSSQCDCEGLSGGGMRMPWGCSV